MSLAAAPTIFDGFAIPVAPTHGKLDGVALAYDWREADCQGEVRKTVESPEMLGRLAGNHTGIK